MSFWEGLGGVGDAVDGLLDRYLEFERIKAEAGAKLSDAELEAILNRPDSVTQRPNAEPSQPSTPSEVTAGSGTGAGSTLINIGGMQVNRTALYVAGAALTVALVLRVAK